MTENFWSWSTETYAVLEGGGGLEGCKWELNIVWFVIVHKEHILRNKTAKNKTKKKFGSEFKLKSNLHNFVIFKNSTIIKGLACRMNITHHFSCPMFKVIYLYLWSIGLTIMNFSHFLKRFSSAECVIWFMRYFALMHTVLIQTFNVKVLSIIPLSSHHTSIFQTGSTVFINCCLLICAGYLQWGWLWKEFSFRFVFIENLLNVSLKSIWHFYCFTDRILKEMAGVMSHNIPSLNEITSKQPVLSRTRPKHLKQYISCYSVLEF